MSHHQLAPTTHTIELRQAQEINRRLAAGHAKVTAETLGVVGLSTASPASFGIDVFGTARPAGEMLRPTATLRRITAEGAPEFPYVLGHFVASRAGNREGGASLVLELHSDVLGRLSAALGLRHCWGTGAALAGTIVR